MPRSQLTILLPPDDGGDDEDDFEDLLGIGLPTCNWALEGIPNLSCTSLAVFFLD